MKKLFLFARGFPYNISEPYLETEIKYYEKFDEVHIFSLSVYKDDEKREIYKNTNYFFYVIDFKNYFTYFFSTILLLFNPFFYREILYLIKNKKYNLKNLISLMIFLSREQIERKEIEKIIKNENLVDSSDEIVLYSYRFDYSSFLICNLKIDSPKKIIKIIRAHGIDLYEERNNGYLPLRKFILSKIDKVFLISKNSLNYLVNKFPEFKNKMDLSYLGTNRLNAPVYSPANKLRVLSCSNIIPVKRVHLIYEALQLLPFDVEWTHFGKGSDFDKLNELSLKSKSNIKIELRGHVPNKELLSIYENEVFDIFINVSSSEGLPVSIMETNSVGIPTIATNVGGTSEILLDKVNGFLLKPDCTKEEIAIIISNFWDLSEEEKRDLRNSAITVWEEKFNSDNNYKDFIDSIFEMLKGGVINEN
ncbi:glycosyltransferase [Globicatella sanguinis]